MERILLIDHDARLRSMTACALADNGYEVLEASGSISALHAFVSAPGIGLVVLDVELERGRGFDLLTEIRRDSAVPVVVASKKADEIDRVLGLRLGADDYLPKPFAMRELIARIGAVLRRCRWGQMEGDSGAIAIGSLTIDRHRRSVSVRGSAVHLTHHEFEVLERLARSPGQAVARDLLLREVWRTEAPSGIDASLTEHVRRLRQKLELDPHQPALIETVRGIGYRLVEEAHG